MNLPNLAHIKGIFVTGTDTGVGKTWVAAGITAVLRRWGMKAGYFKPVQSGCPEENGKLVPTDACFARELAELDEPLDLLTPVTLRLPLAPGVAAAREGTTVDMERIAAAWQELGSRYSLLVTEGAGGLYVPIRDNDFLVLDMVRWLRLPLIVVARPGPGDHQPHRAHRQGGPARRGAGGRGGHQPLPRKPLPGRGDQPRGHRRAQ